MLALPDPASNVTSYVVFTSKKSVFFFFFRLTIVLPNTIIARLAVCFDCFHVFRVSYFSQHPPTSWSSWCYDDFFRKESSCMMDERLWNGEGVLGALRDV